MFTRSSSFFSSSWERKASAAFFLKGGGEANPLGGGGPRTAKSLRRPAPAMQICREQSAPDEGRAGGSQGRMPGQRLWGTPPRLDLRINPECANTAWELEGLVLILSLPCGTFCCTVHGVLGKDLDQDVGNTHPSTFDFFPLQSTSVLCCMRTYSHTPFKSRVTPLSGFVGAARDWAPQDSGHPGVCGQPWNPEPSGHCRLLGVREAELGGVRPPCPHSFVPTFPRMSCPVHLRQAGH